MFPPVPQYACDCRPVRKIDDLVLSHRGSHGWLGETEHTCEEDVGCMLNKFQLNPELPHLVVTHCVPGTWGARGTEWSSGTQRLPGLLGEEVATPLIRATLRGFKPQFFH